MAIESKRKKNDDNPEMEELTVKITNGHLRNLDKIVSDYSIDGDALALAFIISAISQADGTAINVKNKSLTPSENIITSLE